MAEPMDVAGWKWLEIDLRVLHAFALPMYGDDGRLDLDRVAVHGSYTGWPNHDVYTSWGYVPGRVKAKDPGSDRAAQIEGRVPIWAEMYPVDDDRRRAGPTRVWVAVYEGGENSDG
jgi:hypothetical protein